MTKIKDSENLKRYRECAKKSLTPRLLKCDRSKIDKNTKRNILVCGGPGCNAYNSEKILKKFNEKLKEANLLDNVKVILTGCFGFCSQGPVIEILPDNVFYVKVSEDDIDNIIESHILNGKIVESLLYKDPVTGKKYISKNEIPFYKKQLKIALRNCGVIDPFNIDDAIGAGAYSALDKVLKMDKTEVIDEIKKSGLRGRGGGGFPTGIKWESTFKAKNKTKYVICNADEGDPGAFMDRAILEGDPHSVIEAMAICAYAIEANKGIVYIRCEYPTAIKSLQNAINEASELGLLGENILGSGFDFNIELKFGAGAFVCGEATALLRSTEGGRGEPTIKPPRTSVCGLFKKPTCVNNVETFACVPYIILEGADHYSLIGTEKSKGTKVFALAGKIKNVGLVEVPMGTTLNEVIYDIGGGIKDDKELKAVQTGGPSGGCIPKELMDTKIDYESLKDIGTMIGSGGMIVIDEDNCMVDIAKFYLDFSVEESCGKCTPCRIGTKRLLELLEKVTRGDGTKEDLDSIYELSKIIKDTSLCGLGKAAPNPVLSTLTYFKDEYESHVLSKKCPAHVCRNLLSYEITNKCIGCTKCAKNCPVSAISGVLKGRHTIDTDKCIKCGTCIDLCPMHAIKKV